MIKTIGIILGISIIAGIGFFVFSGDKTKTNEVVTDVTDVQNEELAIEAPTNEASPSEQPNAAAEQTPQMSAGSYEAYSAEKIAMAATGDVVLFFHASWCPSCRALNGDIETNAGSIPAGLTILKTDYDTETDLKKKYGVTTQHTLVQIDEEGNLINKWSGGSKLENLLSEIQ